MAATEILPAQQADGQLFHHPGPRTSSPSSSSLFLAGSPPPISSSPKPPTQTPPAEHHERILTSPPIPSPEPQPQRSTLNYSFDRPFNSTRSNNDRLLGECGRDEDEIDFPNYGGGVDFSNHDDGYESTQRLSEDESDAPEISTTTDTTQSDSPLPTPTIQDDTAIHQEPTRHVDYLSHNWREEDIWASWRHIVSQRRVYGQRSRLENASWRTWAKSKYHLQTISPETLNWLKESDVTWLYGPLKPATSHPVTSNTSEQGSSQISKNSSFVNKKPILKKRSVSEVMLQKSLSASSLVKQAASYVQAQQGKQLRKGPYSASMSDFSYSYYSAPSNPPSRDEIDYFSSRTSSTDNDSPMEGQREKHIRFDEKVEQCIAVDCKEGVFDDESELEVEDDPPESALKESSSDEGLVMMKASKRTGPKKDGQPKGKLSRSNSSSGQMIETLPSTTLKYRTDSPDVAQEAAQHHVFGKDWNMGSKLSPSPSQETLRPTRPSRNFLLADDDDDGDGDTSSSWSFGASNPKSSLGASGGPFNPTDGYDGIDGMRRTESGMFMPYDEDEDDMVATGLFGRVSETINTFKDISHVLWNVGWRK